MTVPGLTGAARRSTGPRKTHQEYGASGKVTAVALSAEGRLLASGGLNATVRLWEVSSGACLRVLRPERRYERTDITNLSGVTEAQRVALLALGAVEHST